MLGRTNDSAGRFLTDCVEVAYRLPRLWAAVQNGLVAGWRARLIAQTTLALTLEAATYVDEQVFWCASRLTPSALGRLVDEARVRYMPDAGREGTGEVGRQAARHLRHPAGLLRRHHGAGGQPGAPRRAGAGGGGEVRGRAPREARVHRHHRRTPRHRARGPGPAPAHHRLRRPRDSAMVRGGPSGARLETSARPRSPSPRSSCTPTCPPTPSPTLTRRAGEALCARVEQAGQRLLSVEQIRAWCGRPDVAVDGEPGDRPARAARVPGLRAHREDP